MNTEKPNSAFLQRLQALASIEKGITLVESIVVIVIIGSFAAMALPKLGTTLEKFKASEGEQILLAILAAQQRYWVDSNENFADDLADLDIEMRTSNNFDDLTDSNISTSDPLASITRTGSYTLSIDAGGIITCAGGPAGLCSKLGY